MANKRKRDEGEDSDYDEPAPGKQLLPVANLPNDFDKEPQDGLEYLFLVRYFAPPSTYEPPFNRAFRRDARRLPHFTRVPNPYETTVVDTTVREESSSQAPASGLPCEEWRAVFQSHFRNLKKPIIHVHFDPSRSTGSAMPEKKDRDAWWKYLAGFPESEWSSKHRASSRKKFSSLHGMRAFPHTAEIQSHDSGTGRHLDSSSDVTGSIIQGTVCQTTAASATASCEILQDKPQMKFREVTPSHLRNIDHRMSIHLLMYFTHWINLYLQNCNDSSFAISGSHTRWIFALLIKVEDQLSADDMNLLRNLARACLGLVKSRRNKALQDPTSDEVSRPVTDPVDNARAVTDAACWMVFSAIAGHWGQKDLWVDAETTLADV